ncbi:hypothetical protein DW938_11700 [Ruminococcus sp. AM43-6]|nr:hypothetical protein DW938_11700 [Ruminococcus sp. AM43-6]
MFLANLTKNLTAQYAHNSCAVLPKAYETACRNDEDTGGGNQRALQLLWSERKLPFDTKISGNI